MEDVDYLEAHGDKVAFQFMVDSKNRDKTAWPTPSEYVIPFTTAFTHVVAVDVLEASIPRTNYNVDDSTCTLALSVNDGPYQTIVVDTGDYDILTLCTALSAALAPVTVTPTSVPAEVKSTLTFTSPVPFTFDFNVPNTMGEVLGFDAPSLQGQPGYAYVSPPAAPAPIVTTHPHHHHHHAPPPPPPSYRFGALPAGDGSYVLVAPGIYSLVGDRYVLLRCAEAESSRDASSEIYSPGIAKFTLGVVGFANASLDYARGGVREFHPIGRLSRLTLRFERPDGTLYNFRGVNHTLTLVLRSLAPRRDKTFARSSLNRNYDGNFLAWRRTDEEREGDSDEDTDAYNAKAAPLAEAKRAEGRAAPAGEAGRRAELVRKIFE